MHVAVCDDNVADRKQMERLLGRESDRRAKLTEGLYIDSYGNEKALLSNPMQYDIFYIDICKSDGIDGMQVANKLCAIGVHVPIYMCCSNINYRQQSFSENIFFIDKPIKTNDLIASLDHAYDMKKNSVPMIELREEKETHYVTEADIMYGIVSKMHVEIHLTDGKKVRIASGIENLFEQWAHYETFLVPTSKAIINVRYLDRIGHFHIYMKDGTKFSIHHALKEYARMLIEKKI